MKVKVTKLKIADEVVSFKIKSIEDCCGELISDKFTLETDGEDVKLCVVCKKTISTSAGIINAKQIIPLEYCPFCNEKIEIEISEEDISDKIEQLKSDFQSIGSKIDALDEEYLIKRAVYLDEISFLRKKLSSFLDSDL